MYGVRGKVTYVDNNSLFAILAHRYFVQISNQRNIHRFSFVRSSMRKILRILLSAPSARKVLPVPSKHRTSSFSAFSSILWANSNTELMISYGDSPRQGERRHGVFIYGVHWPICSKLIVWWSASWSIACYYLLLLQSAECWVHSVLACHNKRALSVLGERVESEFANWSRDRQT